MHAVSELWQGSLCINLTLAGFLSELQGKFFGYLLKASEVKNVHPGYSYSHASSCITVTEPTIDAMGDVARCANAAQFLYCMQCVEGKKATMQ